MNIKLKDFFNYKPIYDEKQIDEFFENEVKKPAVDYLWEEAWEQIQKAYDFAKKSHGNEKRLSWEPYIVHPVYVAKYLMMIKPWLYAIQAALLHDVIEDTPVTAEEIKKEFWPEVAFLCLGLEKVSKVRYHGEDRQIETLKKTFLAMGHDIRVIFVKLADRIHNIQTLKYHPKREKQERIANETLKIYAPIAKRLWIEVFQLYLENGAFAILEPEEFNRIFNYLEKNYSKVNIDKLIKKLKILLKEANIEYLDIKGRLKSPYRIYLKFQKYNTRNIEEIKDILAFRIIVKDIPTCYTTLGVIHSKYTPIIKRIKDYISIPKPNWYQSLHTTILGLYKTPVEIQIRTKEMDELAEYGVAAHFIYKELWDSKQVSSSQIEWVNKLKEIAKEYQEWKDNKSFFNILDVDFLRKSVFVYTPAGKIIELPRGATVLDFAFRIHTDIWLRFKSALVNGKIVPIDYKLRNGDIVEIKTFKNKYSAKKAWLDYVVSPTSKNKIRQFLNHLEREKFISLGKEILNEELKKYKLPELNSKENKISSVLTEEELNRNLILIASRNITPWKLIRTYYPEVIQLKNLVETETKEKINEIEKQVKDQVIIDNSKLFKYTFCPECKPSKWDKIIWKVTKEWIKIHKTTCKALKTVNFQKLVEAHWEGQEDSYYDVLISFDISWKLDSMVDILNTLKSFNIKLSNVNSYSKWDKNYLDVTIKVKLPTTLHLINQKLKKETSHLFNRYKIKFI
jgi:guanosine-3',5'-bis(diphosphate) 3'-pyrophosphohydrolase